jgi:gas vesicle protein
VSGLLDRENDLSKDTFVISGKGVEFAAKTLSLAGTELKWTPDDANVQGQIISTAGDLDGKVSLVFPSNQFAATGTGESSKLVAAAVQKINAFSIDILVSGTVKRPKFVVNSDLDNQLSSAFSDVAKEKYDAWLTDVKAQLDSEVAKLRKPVDDALDTLEAKKQDIDDEIKAFEDEVEAEVRSLEAKVEAEQKRIEDKAKAELDDAKAKAEAEAEALRKKAEDEKRKAEEAAKKEAEQKLKEEADKLKGKLKF